MKDFNLTKEQRFIVEFFDKYNICVEWVDDGFVDGLTSWIPYWLIGDFRDLFPNVAFQEPFVKALLREYDIYITNTEELLECVDLDPEVICLRGDKKWKYY